MTKYHRRKRQNRPLAQTLRDAAEAERVFEQPDPLKQYVRRFGWLTIISDYVQKLRLAELDRPWKYLTMPGKYSIDIGLLWRAGLIDKNSDGKLCVAICDEKHAEDVAGELRVLGGVLAYSNRRLNVELTLERSTLRREFPFDVVNLDLCNSLIQAENIRNLKAIEWIFKLQKGQSFLLLLTTRPDRGAREHLVELLNQNLVNEDEFRNAYIAEYGAQNADRSLNDFTRFTQIVFPKAIARWARYRGYRTTEHFVAKYRRPKTAQRPVAFDMICHSFELEPLGLRAPAKVHAPRFAAIPANNIDERLSHELPSLTRTLADTAYIEFIRTLPPRQAKDIDAILMANQALRTELSNESQSLIGWTNVAA
jgi:hypothetical protein